MISVYDTKGKVVEEVGVPEEIFGTKVNEKLMAQAVRVYLANQRRGTVSTKTRGEVRGSTRKIYKQKGTGRARHGSVRAPIFVHGGLVFGPKPREYSLSLPDKMRRRALFSAMTSRFNEAAIKVVVGLEKIPSKTKEFKKVLDHLSIPLEKGVLLVLPSISDATRRVVLSARNIEGVTYLPAGNLNTYQVLKYHTLLFAKEALSVVESTFTKKEKA